MTVQELIHRLQQVHPKATVKAYGESQWFGQGIHMMDLTKIREEDGCVYLEGEE